MRSTTKSLWLLGFAVLVAGVVEARAEPSVKAPEVIGHVRFHQKISETSGGFTGMLPSGATFGGAVASLGDLDGDGNVDLAVGAGADDDGGFATGSVWILFLHANGTVKAHQKISATEGGFTGMLDNEDIFGRSVVSLGDLDGDGIVDLAVGASGDDDGGLGRGAVWILFLHTDGTVRAHQKISASEGSFTGTLDDGDLFGESLALLSGGSADARLVVGARGTNGGGMNRGAVWILSISAKGIVETHQKISVSQGGFTGTLDDGDAFGGSVASLGDLDGDGNADLAVGAIGDDGAGLNRGAVWILFLRANGTVERHQKINGTEGGFAGTLEDSDFLGNALASVGDLDCDGVIDLAVGASGDDDGGTDRGALWTLFLTPQGVVQLHSKVSSTSGGFTGFVENFDALGFSVASIGDLDGDGNADLAVGAPFDGDGLGTGAVWILFLDGNGCFGRLFNDGFETGDTSAWSDNQP